MNDQVNTADAADFDRAEDEAQLAGMIAEQAAEAEDEVEINLPDMSYDNLERVKEAVIAKQREQRNKEKDVDLNTVKALVGKHGLKWSDIKPAKPASKVAAKYRNPETGAEWSGRGKPPLWIKDIEDRTQFLIG